MGFFCTLHRYRLQQTSGPLNHALQEKIGTRGRRFEELLRRAERETRALQLNLFKKAASAGTCRESGLRPS
jgi:hypothetical protein